MNTTNKKASLPPRPRGLPCLLSISLVDWLFPTLPAVSLSARLSVRVKGSDPLPCHLASPTSKQKPNGQVGLLWDRRALLSPSSADGPNQTGRCPSLSTLTLPFLMAIQSRG